MEYRKINFQFNYKTSSLKAIVLSWMYTVSVVHLTTGKKVFFLFGKIIFF